MALGLQKRLLLQSNLSLDLFGGLIPSYVGQLATGAIIPNAQNGAATTSSNSRSRHIARTSITDLGVVEANWIVNNTPGEVVTAGSVTVAYGIEYPVGTFTRITWSGASSIVVAAGASAQSDLMSISIPNGAEFFIRRYETSSAVRVFINAQGTGPVSDLANGEAYAFSNSAFIGDLSISGTITNYGGSAAIARPAAVIGHTRKPSIYIWGDSIARGINDSFSGTSGVLGVVAQAVGPYFGYINGAVPGQNAQNFAGTLSNYSREIALAKAYTSHLFSQMGHNDLYGGGETSAAFQAFLATCWAALGFPASRTYQSTVTPRTTSTDSWATLVNQTAATGNVNRVIFNNALRAGSVSGVAGYFEFADVVESARDSGIWNVPAAGGGTTSVVITADGIHPNQAGNLLFANPSVFNGSSIHYP